MLGNLRKGLELDVADVVPGKDDITTTKHGGNEDVGPVVRYGQIGDSRHGLLNDNLLQAVPQWYFFTTEFSMCPNGNPNSNMQF